MKIVIFSSTPIDRESASSRRVRRFIRCIKDTGDDDIVVVTSGDTAGVKQTTWGQEIQVRTFVKACQWRRLTARMRQAESTLPARKLNLNVLSRFLVFPDTDIIWAMAAIRNKEVLQACDGADWVISTSPLESNHVAAACLARKLKANWLMDMRDGWIDEPLKPWLKSDVLRKWIESRIEGKLVKNATIVTVTSSGWLRRLADRYPKESHKFRLLRNAAPQLNDPQPKPALTSPRRFVIMHAGSLSISRQTSAVDLYQDALRQLAATIRNIPVELVFVGALTAAEKKAIAIAVSTNTLNSGMFVTFRESAPYTEMLRDLQQADGFLLFNNSQSAIPSKLYDYLSVGAPVLAVTLPADSSAHQLCKKISNVFCLQDQDNQIMTDFVNAVQCGVRNACPDEYSELEHARILRQLLAQAYTE